MLVDSNLCHTRRVIRSHKGWLVYNTLSLLTSPALSFVQLIPRRCLQSIWPMLRNVHNLLGWCNKLRISSSRKHRKSMMNWRLHRVDMSIAERYHRYGMTSRCHENQSLPEHFLKLFRYIMGNVVKSSVLSLSSPARNLFCCDNVVMYVLAFPPLDLIN